MEKPAGVQLRRWFTYMVALLLFANIAAVGGGVLTYNSVRKVTATYQPFAVAAGKAERFTVVAQRDMYEYLSELSESVDSTLKNIDNAIAAIEEARALAPSDDKAGALTELKTIAGQYRLAVEQLPNAMKGSRDWQRVEEIRRTAIRFGGEVAKRTRDLATWSQDEIRSRNQTLAMMTTGALATFVVVFLLSVFVLLALRHWWTRFQEMLLGI